MKDRGNWIKTFTGEKFYVLDPKPEEIHIEDIAHALSNQCRFGGHVKKFYSVAEHCYHVSEICHHSFALDGLLHDASEAYLVDIPRPIKHMTDLKGYRRIETIVQKCIDQKWGTHHSRVKQDDSMMLAFEVLELMPNPEDYEGSSTNMAALKLPYEKFGLDCWSPRHAEAKFIARFQELQNVRQQSQAI